MSHLQEVELHHGEEVFKLKPTHKALYKCLKNPALNGRLALLAVELEQMNIELMHEVLKHFSNDKRSVIELLELDISLTKLATAIGESLQLLMAERD